MPVAVQSFDLHPPPQNMRNTGRKISGHAFTMRFAVVMRDDEFIHILTNRLRPRPPESAFRSRIEFNDASLCVGSNDAIQG